MFAENTFIAIDLKSFYASVECWKRERDPLRTNLVVADLSRTEKTICLAVSPSLKAYGIPGRTRLFEVVERVKEINAERLRHAPGHVFTGESDDAAALAADPSLRLSYITATPRMALYMKCSADIYRIYLRYIAAEDIHVYSVDEVFLDVTHYLKNYGMTAHELARRIIGDILAETKITATAGIGTNLYLAKVAMDIGAKHISADRDGVRIAALDEESYRRTLWTHRPLTDFWRVGGGYARKLAEKGLYTMGDIARCSLGGADDFYNEDLLYDMFGINAELLIDHAWGIESCTMADIKAYTPEETSLSQGQVLSEGYPYEKAYLVIREMADVLSLDLLQKGLMTDQIVLDVGYDIENLKDEKRRAAYHGAVQKDRYGRTVPEGVHGSKNLGGMTVSSRRIMDAAGQLFSEIVDPALLVRRMYITAARVKREAVTGEDGAGQRDATIKDVAAKSDAAAGDTENGGSAVGAAAGYAAGDGSAAAGGGGATADGASYEQLSLFSMGLESPPAQESSNASKIMSTQGASDASKSTSVEGILDVAKNPPAAEPRERQLQNAVLSIKDRYGKNAVLRGMNYLDGATQKGRNEQIGGHKA